MHSNEDTRNNCRVCGFNQNFEPWGEDGKTPTFDICGCCGVQFGYEDCTVFYVRRFREEWIKNGAEWFSLKEKPKGWSLEEQMKNIPKEYL